MKPQSSLQAFAWLLAAFLVGVLLVQPIVDPDLFWHIAVGRWIVSHGEVPSIDHWNAFSGATPWRAYSWLPEIVFSLVDGIGEVKGLLFLKFLSIGFFSLSLAWCYRKVASDSVIGLLTASLVMLASYNHLTLRPQVYVWILFALGLVAANSTRELSSEKKSSFPLIYAGIFGALGCVWANTHLTTIIGLVGFSLTSFSGTAKNYRTPIYIALSVVVGSLLTPYLGGEWITFFSKTSHPMSHSVIAEFRAATILQYSTGFLILLSALVLTVTAMRCALHRVGSFALALLLLSGSLAVVKFIPFAAIVLGMLFAEGWKEHKEQESNFLEGLRRLRALILKIPSQGMSFFMLALLIVHSIGLFETPLETRIVPKSEVDFIIEKKLPFPILNDFGRGGYLIYRLSNRDGELLHKVSIDGRTNVGPPELWGTFLDALMGRRNWEEYLKLVQPKTILWPNQSPLISILAERREWCLVLSSGGDDYGYSVFVHQDSVPSELQPHCYESESEDG